MRNFQEKRTLRHIMRSRPFLILLSIILLVFAWKVFGFWGKMQETASNRQIIEDKIIALQQQKEKLSQDIAKLKTEKGVEENIRDKFGLTKEGEGMIVIVNEKPSLEASTGNESGGFFSFLKNLFR
jgi:cell division protein FtsB